MVPKWLTSYLANYVINQWSTSFGPISNPSVFEVLYLVKYFGGFKYFISHDIKNRFQNMVTLLGEQYSRLIRNYKLFIKPAEFILMSTQSQD